MTDTQKVFIVENRMELGTKEIAEAIGMTPSPVKAYIRKHFLKPPEEIIHKRRTEAILRAKKNIDEDKSREIGRIDKAIEFAKSLGYRNSAEAIGELGANEFKRQFKANLAKETAN